MRLLLDTHIFLWCTENSRYLSKPSRNLIQEADEVYISSASIWEAAIKSHLGKLKVNMENLISAITESGFTELAITSRHAAAIATLPHLHRDPFDRILIAQAMTEPLKFLTSDAMLQKYSGDLVIIN